MSPISLFAAILSFSLSSAISRDSETVELVATVAPMQAPGAESGTGGGRCGGAQNRGGEC